MKLLEDKGLFCKNTSFYQSGVSKVVFLHMSPLTVYFLFEFSVIYTVPCTTLSCESHQHLARVWSGDGFFERGTAMAPSEVVYNKKNLIFFFHQFLYYFSSNFVC